MLEAAIGLNLKYRFNLLILKLIVLSLQILFLLPIFSTSEEFVKISLKRFSYQSNLLAEEIF